MSRCECGRRKARAAVACERCRRLDGEDLGRAAATLLSELRVTGSATWDQLGVDVPYVSQRQVMRGAAVLERGGRLRRLQMQHAVPYPEGKTFFGFKSKSPSGRADEAKVVTVVELVEGRR